MRSNYYVCVYVMYIIKYSYVRITRMLLYNKITVTKNNAFKFSLKINIPIHWSFSRSPKDSRELSRVRKKKSAKIDSVKYSQSVTIYRVARILRSNYCERKNRRSGTTRNGKQRRERIVYRSMIGSSLPLNCGAFNIIQLDIIARWFSLR